MHSLLICVGSSRASVTDKPMCEYTHFPFFSSSPYIHPSFSSGMRRTMTSPSSKLSSVLLLPAVWGKMVRTRGRFTMLLRPVATDTDLERLFSSLIPCSGREGSKDNKVYCFLVELLQSGSKNLTFYPSLIKHEFDTAFILSVTLYK